MKLTVEAYIQQVHSVFQPGPRDISNDFGCAPDNLQRFIDLAVSIYPDSRYTAIEDWLWVDVEIPKSQAEEFRNADIHPCIVYTEKILIDNPDRLFNEVTSTW